MQVCDYFILAVSLLVFTGCGKQSTDTQPSTSGGVALTATQIAGTHWGSCVPVSGGTYGTTVDGMSIQRAITFLTNNTYHISMSLYTGTNCSMGGTELWAYTQFGAYSLATSADSSGLTAVTLVSGSDVVTMYDSTWAGYFNSDCPGGPTNFSTSGTSSNSESGITCSHVSSPDFAFPQFPADGATYYNVIKLDNVSSPTTISIGTPPDIFMPGLTSGFPTSTGLTFTF